MAIVSKGAVNMAERKLIRVITGTDIVYNGRISFIFMFDSNMPRDWRGTGSNFGLVELKRKDNDHFDPWKWAAVRRGELPSDTKFVGDDGVMRWCVNVFNSDGFVLSAGWDNEDGLDKSVLMDTFDGIPDKTIFLLHRAAFEEFEKVCKLLDVTVEAHHFEGLLRTS